MDFQGQPEDYDLLILGRRIPEWLTVALAQSHIRVNLHRTLVAMSLACRLASCSKP
jgi:hypothetical protein